MCDELNHDWVVIEELEFDLREARALLQRVRERGGIELQLDVEIDEFLKRR